MRWRRCIARVTRVSRPSNFHEHLVKEHNLAGLYVDEDLPYSKGLLEKAKRRGTHRRKREGVRFLA